MLRVPRKGSVNWFDIGKKYKALSEKAEGQTAEKLFATGKKLSDEGVMIGIRNLGRSEVNEYYMELHRLKMEEKAETFKMRKSTTKDTAPELWAESVMSNDMLKRYADLNKTYALKFVTGFKGIEGFAAEETQENVWYIINDVLGCLNVVLEEALNLQGLAAEEVLS